MQYNGNLIRNILDEFSLVVVFCSSINTYVTISYSYYNMSGVCRFGVIHMYAICMRYVCVCRLVWCFVLLVTVNVHIKIITIPYINVVLLCFWLFTFIHHLCNCSCFRFMFYDPVAALSVELRNRKH